MDISRYDRNMVKPMWQELQGIGVEPLTSAEQVNQFMQRHDGTAMLVVNSVCGCAAGSARPGVALALQHKIIPDRLATVFAGVDTEAVERARAYMTGIKPSSPSVVLFADGQPVFALERHQIEGRSDEQIAVELKKAFDRYCTQPGPSVPWDQVLKAFRVQA